MWSQGGDAKREVTMSGTDVCGQRASVYMWSKDSKTIRGLKKVKHLQGHV